MYDTNDPLSIFSTISVCSQMASVPFASSASHSGFQQYKRPEISTASLFHILLWRRHSGTEWTGKMRELLPNITRPNACDLHKIKPLNDMSDMKWVDSSLYMLSIQFAPSQQPVLPVKNNIEFQTQLNSIAKGSNLCSDTRMSYLIFLQLD